MKKRLSLNRETIQMLAKTAIAQVAGGGTQVCAFTNGCAPTWSCDGNSCVQTCGTCDC